MMSLNTQVKSALLALTMVVAAVPTQNNAAQVVVNPIDSILTFACEHKVAVSLFVGIWAMFEVRLRTRAKDEFKMEDLREDFKELLNSLNIFEGKLYRQLFYIFDKYVIGLAVKIEDTTTRTKNEDGSTLTLKGKKLVQKPFGMYGLLDAYALMHMKKFAELIPVVAGFYVLLKDPVLSFEKAATKASS